MIPLISSTCRGPLGVCQLPRTWWKISLHHAGLLDPAYPPISRELDAWCLQILRLDPGMTVAFLHDHRPDYLRFEDWIRKEVGMSDPARVDRWNEAVERRVHVNPAKIEETYQDIGLDISQARITSAVTLNRLQDWALFHARDLNPATSGLSAPIPPLISSLDTGALGVLQLPRTWQKVLLKQKNLLHPDYPDCSEGLDAGVLRVLGLDRERTLEFLRTKSPPYHEFEAWVREETGNRLDWDAIGEWSQRLVNRVHPDAKRAAIHATINREDDGKIRLGTELNHLEDWALAHRAIA